MIITPANEILTVYDLLKKLNFTKNKKKKPKPKKLRQDEIDQILEQKKNICGKTAVISVQPPFDSNILTSIS